MKQTKLFLLLSVFCCVWFFGAAAIAAEDPGGIVLAQYYDDEEEEGEAEDAFAPMLTTSVPMIAEVSFTPAAPAAGDPVRVKCRIEMSDKEDEETVVEKVQIAYTVDGGAPAYVDMVEGPAGQFTGEIPGRKAGEAVKFGVRAVDTAGNVAMELPNAPAWPGDLATMIPGAADMDNNIKIVRDDLDFLETYFGADDEWVYVGFKVQGNVNGGTMDPPYIQVYGAKFTNPDTDQGEGLMVGKLAIYVPLGDELYAKFKEELDKVGFKFPASRMGLIDIKKMMANPKEGYVENATPESQVDGGVFIGRIKKVSLGDNPSGYVRCIFLTAANASLDSFMPIPINATPYTQIYFRAHEYKPGG